MCRLYLVNFLDMRGLRLAPGKFWDSDPLRDWIWESFQQKSLSNGYSTFLITGILGIRPLNVRVISRITPSEIKFESHLSSISQYLLSTEYSTYQITRKFWKLCLLRLNVHGNNLSNSSLQFYYPLSALPLNLKLNVRTISAVYPSKIIHWILPDSCIGVTVLV